MQYEILNKLTQEYRKCCAFLSPLQRINRDFVRLICICRRSLSQKTMYYLHTYIGFGKAEEKKPQVQFSIISCKCMYKGASHSNVDIMRIYLTAEEDKCM